MILLRSLDEVINKHLRTYERGLPRWDRVKRWHWNRGAHDRGPIFWCLHWVWCYRPFYWLYALRRRSVSFRMKRHNRRLARNLPDPYDWSGARL